MLPNFTKREAQVAAMLCRGLSAKQMARKLNRSIRTVEVLCTQVYQAVGNGNRAQALYFLGTIAYLDNLDLYLQLNSLTEIE